MCIRDRNRQETNANVIKRFYPNNEYNSILVTKSEPLVDALSAGPLASKMNSPIVLVSNTVHNSQKDVLANKSTDLVYKVGGGINQNSFNEILNLIRK